jgi:hypothetical protein
MCTFFHFAQILTCIHLYLYDNFHPSHPTGPFICGFLIPVLYWTKLALDDHEGMGQEKDQ